MKDTIFAIIISLIASFIYDVLKNFFSRKQYSDSHKFSPKYFNSVKREFFISFPLGIIFSIIPKTGNAFSDLAVQILSFFMFSISLMSFFCLIELVNDLSDDNSNDNPQVHLLPLHIDLKVISSIAEGVTTALVDKYLPAEISNFNF